MEIKQMLLTKNQYSRPGTALKAVKGVVVHYVGNPSSTATANRNYFENLKAGKQYPSGEYIYSSSHYIVGLDGEIIQCVPENEVAYCSNQRNYDTISIECCHPYVDGKFNAKTTANLIRLTADICKRYKLDPLKDVIRHYDVTGKICPKWFVDNPKEWEGFKLEVKKNTAPAAPHWAEADYEYANNNGVTISEKRFDDSITRGEVISLIVRVMKWVLSLLKK